LVLRAPITPPNSCEIDPGHREATLAARSFYPGLPFPASSVSSAQGMVMHKFNIGQSVDLESTMLRQAALGAYEIVHLVPAPDGSPENPRYRIKSIAEKHERVASESELTLSRASESAFS
jgi:hypothetical protein